MKNSNEIVTLDGPSGVGKSTISRKIAATLGYTYLDTGAMYRAVGLYLQRRGVDLERPDLVAASLDEIVIRLLPATGEASDAGVLLNGENVGGQIRTPEMSMIASKVSALPAVRKKLTEMQREIGRQGKIVAEGRDVGTVVFPDAANKFFLDADIRERARRRANQLRMAGKEVDEAEILEMIRKRDRDDSQRDIAPLKKAEDALLIDTTSISIDEVCEKVLERILSTRSR